ncbi:hypothetical protein CSUNSWCD_2208 [Campylobacter showae CSUNSWCD]|uniref:Uncharacterized protein n=1 Tax=Campylobacter showae CSUNSWCD TaxID=1244083 RepID=M5IJL2_9BACT|nr:hypothetical protein CSUNSWCD_2208 [Campylobacter showae CSUNSWCD]
MLGANLSGKFDKKFKRQKPRTKRIKFTAQSLSQKRVYTQI